MLIALYVSSYLILTTIVGVAVLDLQMEKQRPKEVK